jgi:acyl-CoA reductase-like NAD-dependent aldehyde dehydrogenase
VHRSRFDEFVTALTAEAAGLKVGDPMDPQTDVGSMVDDDAAERVVAWTAEAVVAGADVTLGGTRDGATVAPTVVAHPPADAAVVTREVFGALVAVMPYDDFDRALEACNASGYGLQAGPFHPRHRPRHHRLAGARGGRADRQRLVELPPRPRAVRRGQGFRVRPEAPRQMIEDYTVIKTMILRGMSIWGEQ